MEQIITLDTLSGIESIADNFSRMGDNYMYARLRGITEPFTPLSKPLRLDCMTIMLCRRGSFDIEVNLQNYHVRPNTLLIINPHTLIQTHALDLSHVDTYVLFVAREFLVDINIDLNAINIRSLIENRSPALALSEADSAKLAKFLDLLDINAREPETTIFSINVARSLCAAIFYQLLQINFMRISRGNADAESGTMGRRSNYVHDFMRLVHLHHTRERSLAFYASKLFISPKYLTLLVKEATGRSATSWINEFVIIEAKNLLRFSGKNVQQVAYALNFSNQSSFGKYFKHLTGQSPSAYQKS